MKLQSWGLWVGIIYLLCSAVICLCHEMVFLPMGNQFADHTWTQKDNQHQKVAVYLQGNMEIPDSFHPITKTLFEAGYNVYSFGYKSTLKDTLEHILQRIQMIKGTEFLLVARSIGTCFAPHIARQCHVSRVIYLTPVVDSRELIHYHTRNIFMPVHSLIPHGWGMNYHPADKEFHVVYAVDDTLTPYRGVSVHPNSVHSVTGGHNGSNLIYKVSHCCHPLTFQPF
jgi:hypothetical protein